MKYILIDSDFGESFTSWELINFEFFKNFNSAHTRKCYQRDIQYFFNYLIEKKIKLTCLKSIERAHVVAYKSHLVDLSQAPKTICRKLSALSSYFDFLIEKSIIDINPCKGIRRPKQETITETKDLSDEAVDKLFTVLFEENSSKYIYMHRAVVVLLFSTGMRKSELAQLKVRDYQQFNESLFCLKIMAKGGKLLTKILHPTAKKILDEYLKSRTQHDEVLTGEEFLLIPSRNPREPGKLNKSLNPKTIDYILQKYCKKAGINTRVSPHSARATYIGSALENGVALWKISQDVGHSSVRTTEIYNKRRLKAENSPVHSLGFLNSKRDKKSA